MEKILAVYLKRIIDQLENAIDEIDDGLPEGMRRLKEKHYIGNSHFPGLDYDPNNWEEREDGDVIALSPIRDLLDELQDDLRVLIPEYEPKMR